jgi:hypothetical protein
MGESEMELGDLSAQYESGNRGSEAIGWDHAGGLSLGKYQIAFKPGTLRRYLDYCNLLYPEIYDQLEPLYKSILPSSESKRCSFAAKWKELAAAGLLKDSEHKFIKSSHFDRAFELLPGLIQVKIAASMALQQVLWSTAVQHGAGGAKKVFIRAHSLGIDKDEYIICIYNQRSRRLGKLQPRIRSAVLQRYASEKKRALAIAENEAEGASRGEV